MDKLKKYLIENKLVSEYNINQVYSECKKDRETFIELLIKRNLVKESKMVEVYSKLYKVKVVNLSEYIIDTKVLNLLPQKMAEKNMAIVFKRKGNKVSVAMATPYNLTTKDNISLSTGYSVEAFYAFPFRIKDMIEKNYVSDEENLVGMLEGLDLDFGENEDDSLPEMTSDDLTLLLESSEQPLVVKIVNKLILEGVVRGASDIHFEPYDDYLQIRYRIDGIGVPFEDKIPKKYLPSVMSRIKIMAHLDIAERRKSQSGKISVTVGDKPIEIRVETSNTVKGEECTMRVIDMSKSFKDISDAGFSSRIVKDVNSSISKPYGIILISGPTGSGKTSTMYSIINKLNIPEKVILTVEDPVERKVSGLRQHEVIKGISEFNDYLESFLRHDPDIIIIGELRDKETITTAIRAALTGHLVIASIHANNASATTTRLIDMGIPSYMVSSAIVGVLAQRLIRTICPDCKDEYSLSEEEKQFLTENSKRNIDNITFYKGKGCSKCFNKGYRGRTVVGEFMSVNKEIRKMLIEGKTDTDIQEKAIDMGMNTLLDDALLKLFEGKTTIDEVKKVAYTL